MKVLQISDEQKIRLTHTIKNIVRDFKGILAADEKPSSLDGKFKAVGIENNENNRRIFRQIMFTSKDVEKYVGGVILNEETLTQCDDTGKPLLWYLREKNIEIGVKLDKGLQPYGEETVSSGLDSLEQDIKSEKYSKITFAKWRSLFLISDSTPTENCIEENCKVLCEYARICQKNGIVPIIEPEISYDGNYDIERMAREAKKIYSSIFRLANYMNLYIPGMIIKCSFISAGNKYEKQSSVEEVANYTLTSLFESVPTLIGSVVFLSGGHSSEDSFKYLARIKTKNITPIVFSFSFCRALTQGLLEEWKGSKSRIISSQTCFIETLKKCQNSNKGD